MNNYIVKLLKGDIYKKNTNLFTPTCSQYMIDALNEYGLFKGLRLGIKRILRCNPFGKYGHDEIKKEGKTI